MTAAQINCPRCQANSVVPSYYEPHCLTCGWVDQSETVLEPYEDRRSRAKARFLLAEANGNSNDACPAGHPYTESNTWVTRRGLRQCRLCGTPKRERRWRIRGLPVP